MTDRGGRGGADHEPPGRRQRGPFVVRCEPGRYAWCACGRSARYPYCDGSHRQQPDPAVGPIKVQLEQAVTVAWCACGRSANRPFCDGTHGRLLPGDVVATEPPAPPEG